MTDRKSSYPDLRDLARAARDGSPTSVPTGAVLHQATLDVEVDGRRELVVVSTGSAGELRVVASDGSREGAHVTAALDLIARAHVSLAGARAPSEVPSSPGTDRAPPRVANPLADAFEELLTAVVRAGIRDASNAPAVREAIDHVLREARKPTPPGLGRALARLRRAMGEGDVDLVSRVLDGGARLALDLRDESPTDESIRRVAAWTLRAGTGTNRAEALNERELVEVGREWLPAAGAGSVQRRYLVCTTTGEVFREEHVRGSEASVGPCPRVLRVGLAQVEPGPAPRRIRLLQYEVSPEVGDEVHRALAEMAEREVDRVHDRYRQWVRQYPALAEPFVILRAEGLRGSGEGFRVDDDEGRSIELRAEEGVASFLGEVVADRAAGASARWIAGRLAESEGRVVLEPISLGLASESGPRLLRL